MGVFNLKILLQTLPQWNSPLSDYIYKVCIGHFATGLFVS